MDSESLEHWIQKVKESSDVNLSERNTLPLPKLAKLPILMHKNKII